VLREAGYTLLLSSTTNSPEVEMALLRACAARRVDGVMTTISDESHPGVIHSNQGFCPHGIIFSHQNRRGCAVQRALVVGFVLREG
jgi:DNA-binding LacI/PurR family transcriptional regulator